MYLNYDDQQLRQALALETAKEITQQPSTWRKLVRIVTDLKPQLQGFLDQLGKPGEYDILLMGAGTSEYIGNALKDYLNPMTNFSLRSVATTDMVLSPRTFIREDRPTLYISFGRSGNSPESTGALLAIEAVTKRDYHLIITCNKDGALAHYAKDHKNAFAILLPEETNDKGFAMTSSFSNMLLATVLTFNLDQLDAFTKTVDTMADSIEKNLSSYAKTLQDLIKGFDFKRVIYLGSLSMKGYAQESCLKVLELTAGKIATLFDSPTGFRHGPKSFIDEKTLIMIYLHDDPLTRKYEEDLCEELKRQQDGYKLCVISHRPTSFKGDINITIPYHQETPMILAGLQMMVLAHILSFTKSYTMGITTDNPCPTGEVNRVVTGVTLYPVERKDS